MSNEIFEPGRTYKVKLDFSSGSSQFLAGEVLTFVASGYSRYDSSFVYEFHDAQQIIKNWWLNEECSPETWEDYFEPM